MLPEILGDWRRNKLWSGFAKISKNLIKAMNKGTQTEP